ncbi:hypothetical protein SDC9_168460 [bioreactor metagenome]|uniref:Uncharacterized protein n=1 Tax=bioreactor metagenome TaxID=1076179 RepID=A0A645G2L4_9ZZZZ
MEEQRSGGQAVQGQRAQQHGCGRVSGDAQGQQRHHRAADGGVISCFGRDNAINASRSKLFRVLVVVLGHGIGKYVRGAAADAGQNADAQTDQGRTQEVPFLAEELLHGKAKAFDALHTGLGDYLLLHEAAGLGRGDDLTDSKQAHHDGQHIKAALEVGTAEGEAGSPLDHIGADG